MAGQSSEKKSTATARRSSIGSPFVCQYVDHLSPLPLTRGFLFSTHQFVRNKSELKQKSRLLDHCWIQLLGRMSAGLYIWIKPSRQCRRTFSLQVANLFLSLVVRQPYTGYFRRTFEKVAQRYEIDIKESRSKTVLREISTLFA